MTYRQTDRETDRQTDAKTDVLASAYTETAHGGSKNVQISYYQPTVLTVALMLQC